MNLRYEEWLRGVVERRGFLIAWELSGWPYERLAMLMVEAEEE